MIIATWNVNSIRSRAEAVHAWLRENPCDIVLLQELKCSDDQFPYASFEDLNYNLAVFGQPTYNGVAVLSKSPIDVICKGIPGFKDESARYIECETAGYTVSSVYVPNGSEVDSDKYKYKLEFLKSLRAYLQKHVFQDDRWIIGGDFNVALQDIDVFDAEIMKNQICFTGKERETYQQVLNVGFLDALRLTTKDQQFTWWDYRGASLQKNQGMRLDYILLSANLIRQHKKTWVDKTPRLLNKPSDHAPVLTSLLP